MWPHLAGDEWTAGYYKRAAQAHAHSVPEAFQTGTQRFVMRLPVRWLEGELCIRSMSGSPRREGRGGEGEREEGGRRMGMEDGGWRRSSLCASPGCDGWID